MSETPLQPSGLEIENAVLSPNERALRELEQDTYEPTAGYLEEIRAQITQEVGELAQSRTVPAAVEYGPIPEAIAPTYLMAWGKTLTAKREEYRNAA